MITDEILALVERTEGWAVGSELVGLSSRGRRDPEAYIASLAGDDRHRRSPVGGGAGVRSPEVREFLSCTSIVSRPTAPLRDVLVGATRSRDRLVELDEPTCSWSPWMTAVFGVATTTWSVSRLYTSSP